VIPGLSVEMVVVIQALVILFTGAMEGMFRPGLQRIFTTLSSRQKAAAMESNTVKSES
jgi:simple sugar transport system permease protein